MSFDRGDHANDYYFEKISLPLTKSPSHRSIISPKGKPRKEFIPETDIFANKKTSPLKLNLTSKTELLTSRTQVTYPSLFCSFES